MIGRANCSMARSAATIWKLRGGATILTKTTIPPKRQGRKGGPQSQSRHVSVGLEHVHDSEGRPLAKGTCGLAAESDLLVDQILAWDNGLFRRDMGELPEALQDDVRAAVREFLDL